MRLRLHVQRHQLPRVSVLWNVLDSENPTVAELLEQVNDLIPLEAEGWGLEDYAVEVDGFEGLHYMQLHNVMKDEDEVTIRPLQTNDIRARTLGGRHQISKSFASADPDSPRKRRRLEVEAEEGVHVRDFTPLTAQEDNAALLNAITNNIQQTERGRSKSKRVTFAGVQSSDADDDGESIALPSSDDDEEEDEDFSMGSSDNESDSEAQSESSWDGINSGTATPTGKELVLAEDQDEDTSDTDSDSSSASSSEADSSDISSESDDQSSESESEEEALPVKHTTQRSKRITAARISSETRPTPAKPPQVTGKRSTEQKTDSAQQPPTKRAKVAEDTSKSNAAEPQSVRRSPPQVIAPPGEGKHSTKARNLRRRETKKLQHLKGTGALPPNASIADMHAFEAQKQANGGASLVNKVDGQYRSDLRASEAWNRYSGGALSSLSSDKRVSTAPNKEAESDEFQRKRQRLLDAINAGGVDISMLDTEGAAQSPKPAPAKATESVVEEDEAPERQSSKTEVSTKKNVYTEEEVLAAEKAAAEKVNKDKAGRARLDLTASQRLLFGSLGVRRPRNDADREKVKQKLAAQSQRKPVSSAEPETQPELEPVEEDSGSIDPNAWRSRINLSAVECCDEDVRQKKRKRASNTYAVPRKSRASNQDADTYYAGDGTAEDWDYDEYPEESYLEKSHADEPSDPAAAQLLQETNAAQGQQGVAAGQEEHDDFPPLPEDVTTLPLLNPKKVVKDDILLFSRLEVSAATNWTPAQSPLRTARVLDVLHNADGEAKTLELQLAKRDLPHKQYDNQGNRMYSKFEMQTDEDEDEFARFLTVDWTELCDVRVLKKADAVVVGDATAEEGAVNGEEGEGKPNGAEQDEVLTAAQSVQSEERERSVEL
ncbi:hypothetical protein H2203_004416 [Taxawa tesnikishii (nom. ined.)]|nr:hypothetical protein H2203_004416 [Dothideales sp. JES 119]